MGRNGYNAKFKADRVIEVLVGEEHISTIASRHNLDPDTLRSWKKEFLEKSPQLFEGSKHEREKGARERAADEEREELLLKVGQLEAERDWLKNIAMELFGDDYEKTFGQKPV